MKTTLTGLQALQIALRNRVERLPDGSIAIKIKNDFQCVTLGDLAAFVEASSGRIRFSRKDLDSDYNFYFMEMSRNQAKRLRKKLQQWVDAEIENEIAAQCAERGQAASAERMGMQRDSPEFKIFKLEREVEGKKLLIDGLTKMLEKALSERDELRAKYEERGKVLRDVDNARDAILRRNKELHQCLEAFEKENKTLRATNAELVRQAQAHNQETIQLREALSNMTRLRDEALGNPVRLPNEGEVVEYRNTESAPWKTCSVAFRPHGRPYAPDAHGVVYLSHENHGILWRWPAKKERTAADAKVGDLIWFEDARTKRFAHITSIEGNKVNTNYYNAFVSILDFGKSWGFAD